MILSTVPGMVVLGCSGIRVVSRFSSAIFADLAMRGFPISFVTLARVALMSSFLALLMRPSWHRDRTVTSHFAQLRNTQPIDSKHGSPWRECP